LEKGQVRERGSGDKVQKFREVITVRLSTLEPGHLVETGTCLAKENNPLFLTETFIRLSRVYEEYKKNELVRLTFVTVVGTD
jgi:hypothetical protein